MPWLQVSLLATPVEADLLCDLLTDAGANTVSLQAADEEAIYEAPPDATVLWSHTRVIGLFSETTIIDDVLEYLRTSFHPGELPDYQIERLNDEDWQNKWMEGIQPQCLGNRLWIYPSWHTSPHEDTINIILDPGLAFGTGTHPTTALCLEWLDQHNINGWKIIDYGCGSGILSIAAIKLGAAYVWAVDIDPQAITATSHNADKNNVRQHILSVLPVDLPQIKCDCLIANILANPILRLTSKFADIVVDGGYMVLSGILSDQIEKVIAGIDPFFDVESVVEREQWGRIVARRQTAF